MMTEQDFDELEQSFVAEGRPNGSLEPTVVRNVGTYGKGGHTEDDFYVGFSFHYTDWEALFFDVLKCPERETEIIEGEDFDTSEKREYEKFHICTAEYPLLGRIFDIYHDAGYEAGEVREFREQCLRLHSSTVHEGGRRALAKLILACDKALKAEMGLLLISD